MSSSPFPTFTSDQIRGYYERIRLPRHYQYIPVVSTHHRNIPSWEVARDSTTDAAIRYLTALQQHHLAAIPFENLNLHYNKHHDVLVDPESLFEKIVSRGDHDDGEEGIARGRGGYCMESNRLFGLVLQSLGFEAYQTGARVSGAVNGGSRNYGPWNHCITIVIIGSERYFVDVGFGAGGPTFPVPLSEASSRPMRNMPSQQIRLLHTAIPEAANQQQKSWVYEVNQSDDDYAALWSPYYCFSETEFLHVDFAMMNFNTSHRRTSWFKHEVVCVKFLLNSNSAGSASDGGEKDDKQIVGYLSLDGKSVKRRLHGKTEVVAELNKEDERVRALEEWFGVHLEERERQGIKGLTTALPD